jgi:hypothetical protein
MARNAKGSRFFERYYERGIGWYERFFDGATLFARSVGLGFSETLCSRAVRSRKDLVKNADGSVDLYVGAEAPQGKEKNWIPTAPGRGWFAYFRLYAPTEPYFDRSWSLPDVERVK